MNIGLLGGSFDPVHRAHLALAHAAQQALQLDELRFVPAGQPWQKLQALGESAITPAADRLAMLQAAIEDAGHPQGWVLERCELDRDGPSYSIDTVTALQAVAPLAPAEPAAPAEPGAPTSQWFLIIGQDQLARLHTWRRWRELLQRVTLAVAARPGAALEVPAEVRAAAQAAHPPQGWEMVPLPRLDISSTDIRRRVAAGADISGLVSPGVARYIAGRPLYAEPARGHGAHRS